MHHVGFYCLVIDVFVAEPFVETFNATTTLASAVSRQFFRPNTLTSSLALGTAHNSAVELKYAPRFEACKCESAASLACDTSNTPLSPNDELLLCIKSKSTDVEVDYVESMVKIIFRAVLVLPF